MSLNAATKEELLHRAWAVRENSHSPYSSYRVGAAALDERGRIHVGTNVENVAYGSTLCAERSAILRLVSDGGKRLGALAVVTQDGGLPCGACLQVIAEFADSSVTILIGKETGSAEEFRLAELLPKRFESDRVTRTSNPP